jgi:hypothetical protein
LFQTISGDKTYTSDDITIHPLYDEPNNNNDLAIIWLTSAAPHDAERYNLYRQQDELYQEIALIGYGKLGTGELGGTNVNDHYKHLAYNRIDADIGILKSKLGGIIGWQPLANSQFVADFDNGTQTQDALGRLINIHNTGLGNTEGLIAPGDSGGPAFINKQLIGIASYTTSLSKANITPDIDTEANSSFGEIAAWQNTQYYQQWIDQSIRENNLNAPTTPQEVHLSLPEGNKNSINFAYFLLQFTGVRNDPEQNLSVDYITRDGSATAGQDYIAQIGTLILYPNETQATIAIEVIGDTQVETDETFYLEVFNPVGGSFGSETTKLIAMRTILNDDLIV